jgi:luciferase family oxidoreductase group 1
LPHTVSYSLSLLDKSLIPEGADAAQAFQHTIALAQSAERLGYRRYWLAEHHGNRGYAGSAPEVLASHVLAKTSRIRVGTGGVMLQHYSPFKVAETFPGARIARAGPCGPGRRQGARRPAADQQGAAVAARSEKKKEDFAVRLAELDAFLHDGVAADHALAGAVATPNPPQLPQRVLLGGTPESAVLAARLGWEFVYAGHFNGDPVNIGQSIEAYRSATGRAPLLALFAFAAETHEKAAELVGALRSFKVHLPSGQSVNLGSLEAAAEFARQAGVTDYRTEERRPHVIAGTADEVRGELDALSERYGIEEFVIDIPVAGFAERATAVELLARAREPALA